jgi:hypothetical protein
VNPDPGKHGRGGCSSGALKSFTGILEKIYCFSYTKNLNNPHLQLYSFLGHQKPVSGSGFGFAQGVDRHPDSIKTGFALLTKNIRYTTQTIKANLCFLVQNQLNRKILQVPEKCH